MLGLFGSLNMGRHSLQAHQQGIEVTGHNLANVNNPAYARQRTRLETATPLSTHAGIQGTGVDVGSIAQLRNAFLDRQIAEELSTGGYWQARNDSLELMQSTLGQTIDRHSVRAEGAAAADIGGQQGIADGIQDFFGAVQTLTTEPASMAQRQVLLQRAISMASRFNETSERLTGLNAKLNELVTEKVGESTRLLEGIASLNDQIATAEVISSGPANDLRDIRQGKLEELAGLVSYIATEDTVGAVNISVGGVLLVTGERVTETLEAYDPGDGQLGIRAKNSGENVSSLGGSLDGVIESRNGPLADLRSDLDTLAGELIGKINGIHAAGFGLGGGTGEPFFVGSVAVDMAINSRLLDNPRLVQASAISGASGNNEVAMQMARLADVPQDALGGLNFSQSFARTAAGLGQELANAMSQSSDQQAVERMLKRQRDSVSGVSLDEEMADLVKYQRAYQASAKLITTIDQMLQTVIALK
jgi:flagellar hook-associated protein 1